MGPLEIVSVLGGLIMLGCLGMWGAVTWRQYRRRVEDTKRSQEAFVRRVERIENQMLHIGQAVLPISTAFQAVLIRELTHFHTPETDALLAKLGPPYRLTPKEEDALLLALRQREIDMGDQISASEREAAHIFPIVMKRVKAEAQALENTNHQLRLVMVDTPGPGEMASAQLIQAILTTVAPKEPS